MSIFKIPKILQVVLSWTCDTFLWGNPTPLCSRLKPSSPQYFLLLLILLQGRAEYSKEKFIASHSQLRILTVTRRHWVQPCNPVNITQDWVTEPSRNQSLCDPLEEMPRDETIDVNLLARLITLSTIGFWTNTVITKHECWLSIEIHIEGLGGELSESFRKVTNLYVRIFTGEYTAFEMWWPTRRNQISSFDETGESI